MTSAEFDELTQRTFARHRAFWTMAEVAAPLRATGRYRPLQRREPLPLLDGSFAAEGALLRPDLIDVGRLAGRPNRSTPVTADGFIRGSAPYDFCWNEAIAGCAIRWSAGHVWSEPFLERLEDMQRLRIAPDNAWLAKLREYAAVLVKRAEGRYPIVQPLLRGPIDIACAAFGDERICWTMLDEPDRFHRLLAICTDTFLTVVTAWQSSIPRWHAGGCEHGIWAPGTVLRTQEDNAVLCSPHGYRQFLRPCDERICAACDHALIHTHAGGLPVMVDSLIDLAPLSAIQVSLDWPAGPSVEKLLPLFRRINERKPLIISGAVTAPELDTLLKSLSPRGLCLQVAIRDEKETGHGEIGDDRA